MRVTLLFTFICLILTANVGHTKDTKTWNNKRAAVVLSYDDALNTHLDYVAPALETKGFRGTFYLTAAFPGLGSRIQDWRALAAKGHELGNHTLFHPCTGGEGREWVSTENDLRTWSESRFVANYQINNILLEAIDGKKERTLAYPCGDQKVGPNDMSYVEAIKPLAIAARAAWGQPQTREQVESNLYNISATLIVDNTGAQLIKMVDDAIKHKTLLVFLFHGVGGEHNLNVSKEAHAQLLDYLKKKQKMLWIAPMVDVVHYLNQENAPKPKQKPSNT